MITTTTTIGDQEAGAIGTRSISSAGIVRAGAIKHSATPSASPSKPTVDASSSPRLTNSGRPLSVPALNLSGTSIPVAGKQANDNADDDDDNNDASSGSYEDDVDQQPHDALRHSRRLSSRHHHHSQQPHHHRQQQQQQQRKAEADDERRDPQESPRFKIPHLAGAVKRKTASDVFIDKDD
jgi:hypothetical protein